jgi:hypothetical protein
VARYPGDIPTGTSQVRHQPELDRISPEEHYRTLWRRLLNPKRHRRSPSHEQIWAQANDFRNQRTDFVLPPSSVPIFDFDGPISYPAKLFEGFLERLIHGIKSSGGRQVDNTSDLCGLLRVRIKWPCRRVTE